AAVGPGRLAAAVVAAVQRQRGAAHADDVGRHGRVGDQPAVPGGGHEGHAVVPGGRPEVGGGVRLGGGLGAAGAHGDDVGPRVRHGLVHGRVQVDLVAAVGLDDEDAGARGHRVRPLDVEGGLLGPRGVGGGQVGGTVLGDHRQGRVGQVEAGAEGGEVG